MGSYLFRRLLALRGHSKRVGIQYWPHRLELIVQDDSSWDVVSDAIPLLQALDPNVNIDLVDSHSMPSIEFNGIPIRWSTFLEPNCVIFD